MNASLSDHAPIQSELLDNSPFTGYSYSYPHKTAYRSLAPQPLTDLWKEERQQALFLYFHIPFCEFRCGFCNLFTFSQPEKALPTEYLAAVRRQAETVRRSLPEAKFASLALGGGTPTYLSVAELSELFRIVEGVMGADARRIGASCEASPATVSEEKLALLREHGVDRLSLGVQSFDDRESHAMGRPQNRDVVDRALTQIRQAGFPRLNLDLIYGGEGQTVESWLQSVEQALLYQPEELYLYPLYVRQLTGLGKRGSPAEDRRQWDQQRLTLYREARALLLDRGYQQVSFRMFRSPQSPTREGPIYCCQEDGMIGLGCGARSYTKTLHYSFDYAVGSQAILGILHDYIARDASSFAAADYGFRLDAEDQRRRHVIISLLQAEGLSKKHYASRFGGNLLEDLPELQTLCEQGLAESTPERLQLTAAGLELSDAIGPWLYSRKVRELMEEHLWR